MADQCKGLFGRLFGHAYEAVYDDIPPNNIDLDGAGLNVVRAIQALTSSKYKGHVCRRCGAVVHNKEQ